MQIWSGDDIGRRTKTRALYYARRYRPELWYNVTKLVQCVWPLKKFTIQLSTLTPRTALMTSSVVNGEKSRNATSDCTRRNSGGGEPLELDCTLATFSTKKRLNDSTSMAELAGKRPRPSRTSTDCHSFRGSEWSASILQTRIQRIFDDGVDGRSVADHTMPFWQRRCPASRRKQNSMRW